MEPIWEILFNTADPLHWVAVLLAATVLFNVAMSINGFYVEHLAIRTEGGRYVADTLVAVICAVLTMVGYVIFHLSAAVLLLRLVNIGEDWTLVRIINNAVVPFTIGHGLTSAVVAILHNYVMRERNVTTISPIASGAIDKYVAPGAPGRAYREAIAELIPWTAGKNSVRAWGWRRTTVFIILAHFTVVLGSWLLLRFNYRYGVGAYPDAPVIETRGTEIMASRADGAALQPPTRRGKRRRPRR